MSTLPETKKPANHYELLKLKPFEPDPAVIRKHFHKLVEQVRIKLAEDPSSPKWRQASADMTGAMLVLCDARRKAEYDASIGGPAGREARLVAFEKIIKARKVLDEAALEKAKKFADTVNIELHEAIINQKLAGPDTIVPLYADSLGIPFVELGDLTIDEALLPTVPAVYARQNSLTPVLKDADGLVVVASPRPLKHEVEEQLQLRFDARIRQVICTKAAIDEAINKHYPREAAAAQMSQAPQASGGSGKAAKSSGGDEGPQLTRAELKQKRMKVGMICGMLTFFVSVVFSLFVMGWGAGQNFPITVYAGAAALGGIAFGIGFLATNK